MMKRFDVLKNQILATTIIELVVVIIAYIGFQDNLNIVLYILLIIDLLFLYVMYYNARKVSRERAIRVEHALGIEATYAFEYGGISFVNLDDDGTIIWVSNDFEESIIGTNVREMFPEVMKLINGKETTVRILIDDVEFEATRGKSDRVILFKDVQLLSELEQINQKNSIVLGIAHLDNYEDTTAYKEEQTVALIDMNIRQAIVKWADSHDMFIRRIRPDRYLLILNEEILRSVQDEKFSILHQIRTESSQLDVSITLSLAFSRQSETFRDLEDMSNKALELAQGRGGDQVAINSNGEMTYFGGSTEAFEKRSKVRVRVMAQNLGEVITNSTDVVIVGHRMTDFDSFASALGMASIVEVYGKKAHILVEQKDMDVNLSDSIDTYRETLEKTYHFINHSQAQSIIKEKTLVIMVDHHSLEQTQFPDIIENAQRVAILDHHRRTGEFKFKPILSYIEPSASSASELIVELFPYHKKNVVISKMTATFMYTGMIIDTNRFRNRSGSRTFQTAAELRKYGADLAIVEDMLRDNYTDFSLKNKILSTSTLYDDYYVIAAYKNDPLTRTILSQAADEILSVREVEASFVIAAVDEDGTVAISARSKGELNVQVVMERLGGGGHFTGAATVIRNQSIQDIVEQLKDAIQEVREENN